MHRALGWAAYGIPLAFAVWGLRFVLHSGESRALGRVILTPVALLVAAAFAATHVPLASWTPEYGLGGLLGDAVLGSVLSTLPFDVTLSLRIVAVALAAAFVVGSAYALGVSWAELRGFLRFVGQGSVLLYSGAHGLTGRAVSGAADGARAARTIASEARARRAEAAPTHGRSNPAPRFDPILLRESSDDSVMAKITAAVRARAEAEAARPRFNPPPLTAARTEVPTEIAVLERDPAADAGPEPRVQPPRLRPAAKSSRARSEEEPELELDPDAPAICRTPPLSLLQSPSTIVRHHLSSDALEQNARMLEGVLDDFGVRGEIVYVRPGPVVTLYELEPAAGIKSARVIGLADDIARSMSAIACRVAVIPGRTPSASSCPTPRRETVYLRELLASPRTSTTVARRASASGLGKTIGGEPVIADLARMPHLLVAGTTGSGKSVAINTMILSLLYRLTPDECRLIMIDPKMLELSVYDGIPHLLTPVVTDPKKAVVALKWTVREMEDRYRKMSKIGVRNIDGYNAAPRAGAAEGRGVRPAPCRPASTRRPARRSTRGGAVRSSRCPSSSSSSTRWPT